MKPIISDGVKKTRKSRRPLWVALRFLVGKIISIAITIFIGVFITILLTGQPTRRGLGPPESPFETSLKAQIYLVVQIDLWSGIVLLDENGTPYPDQQQALTDKYRDELGLNLPYLPRNLLWTVKALTFDWGRVGNRTGGWGSQRTTADVLEIITQFLPNTLLLVGASYLLVFLIGMPLSLYLARNYGKRVDKIFAILSPVSSVPSWVFGILLITLFAFQFHWLPFGGMYDFLTPSDPLKLILVVAKHMILPVSAIALSLLFQVVYAWRTFFIIYSEEDYVELARAKGLPTRILQKQYIMRPALPYIITSFITTLVSFWQLSMTLEVIFRWPGIGWLYIKEALPNFWGESMEPGELIIAVGIVVIFAYLLGMVVFLLDFFYVLVDPRLRLRPADNENMVLLRPKSRRISKQQRLKARFQQQQALIRDRIDHNASVTSMLTHGSIGMGFSSLEKIRQAQLDDEKSPPARLEPDIATAVRNRLSISDLGQKSKLFFNELRRYPSAIFGLTVILLMLAGSVYALTAFPYAQVGKDYEQKRMVGRSYIPRTALPVWVNWFRKTPLLSTLIMDANSPETSIDMRTLENGWTEKTYTFTFDYPYQEMPSEIFLYFDPKYEEKLPYASLEWQYPDGRTLTLKQTIAEPGASYDFEGSLQPLPILAKNPEWKNWFIYPALYTTPVFKLLFAEPGATQPTPQHGTYHLTVTSLIFEPGGDLEVQLVLLGQVYGNAGTDYDRRDLLVPLFWGMPFALFIGLLGSLITTLVAVLLPAIGVWYGDWVDNAIQRLTEINMVLPGLAIAVLVNVLFNINIWIILGIVVVINAFGSPIKILRSALLQAKESPYIESARSYGASNFRIIIRYLIPRILPVLIPQLVSQVPSFIFWEATLGFFNIKSIYPSWGRIIYDGLARGALYGSAFWVLEPIFLLLLTSLAFALLGFALERILNPRKLDEVPD